MLQTHPEAINVCVSILYEHENYAGIPLYRSLWRRLGGLSTCVESEYAQRSIYLPLKIFRGSVGEFQSIFRLYKHSRQKRAAKRMILLEARERLHFEGHVHPFKCYHPRCDAWLERSGQWTVHAAVTGHDYGTDELTSLHGHKEELVRHEAACNHFEEEYLFGPLRRLHAAWGEDGSEERRSAKEAFVDQLDYDPIYAHRLPAR